MIDSFQMYVCLVKGFKKAEAVFTGTSTAWLIVPVGAVMCILIGRNIHFFNTAFFTANVFLAVNTLRTSNTGADK